MRVFLGQGPAFFDNHTPTDPSDDTVNSAARGVLLSNAFGKFVDLGTGVFLYAQGTLSLRGISGVTLSGTARVEVNTTNASSTQQAVVTSGGSPQSFTIGANTTRVAIDNIDLSIGGQTLTGADLKFSKDGTQLFVGVLGADLSLASGQFSLQNINGFLLVGAAGIAGSLEATINVANPNLSFSNARFSVAVNSGAAAVDQTVVIGPARTNSVVFANDRLSASGVDWSAAGFAAGQTVTITGVTDPRVIREVTGTGNDTIVFTVGQLGTDTESVTVTRVIVADVPAGPYLRVELSRDPNGTGPLALVVSGQTIEGQFALESMPSSTGGTALRIVATDVAMRFSAGGTDVLAISDGEGFVVVNSHGVGASIRGAAALQVPGLAITADLEIAINTSTTNDIDETFTIGTRTVTLHLPHFATAYVRVIGNGITLIAGGQSLSGNFTFEQAGATTTVTIANAAMSLGDGANTFVSVSGASGTFTISKPGATAVLIGDLSVTSFAVTPPPGVPFLLTGSFKISVDTGAGRFAIRVGTPADGATPAAPATLTVSGQQISAIVFAQVETSAAGQRHVLLAISDAEVVFTVGATDLLKITNGTGLFSLRSDGFAGRMAAAIDLSVGPVDISATVIEVEINTRATSVNETFGGQTLGLPAGPYFQVRLEGLSVTVAGQSIRADATITKTTTDLTIAASNVSAVFGSAGGPQLVLS
ncbi:MAG TPA: hypothetical protein VF065_00920, partial [Ilumatobacter sp.]